MKKTLTAILAIIMLVAMSVTAFAAEYTPTPMLPGYTPYAGDDFSEETVYERLMALEEEYPTGTPWGMTKAGGYRACGGFVAMLQEAAFGYKYDGKTMLDPRVHNNIDELRVGDYIHIPSSVSKDGHYVCVIAIEDGTVTVAEGNYNAQVKWGRQFTIKALSPGGAYATKQIVSCYNEDGEVVRRAVNTGYVAPAETTTPAATTTAPADTKTATPAAPAQTTVKETKPAVTTDTIVITNTIDGEKRVVTVTSGNSNSTTKISLNAKMTKTTKGVVIIAEANNTAVTIQHNNVKYTVNAGETLILNK